MRIENRVDDYIINFEINKKIINKINRIFCIINFEII